MAPILQALVAVAVGVLLGLLLLCQMTLVIRSDLAHMRQVVLVVLGRVLLGILFEDLDDLSATLQSSVAISKQWSVHTSRGRHSHQIVCRGSTRTLWMHRL
jgi:hypothetical protein